MNDRTPTGRPAGEVRQALRRAFMALAGTGQQPQPVTWRQAAAVASVGWATAKRTAENMARAGELVPAGTVAVPGASRPMVGYLPAGLVPQALPCPAAANDSGLALQQLFGQLARA